MLMNYAQRKGLAHNGFTLIELLVVIVIIGILASILLVGIPNILFRARVTKCASQLEQLNTAIYTYSAQYRGTVPSVTGSSLWVKLASPEVAILDREGAGANAEILQCPVQADGVGPDYRGPKK